MILPGVPDRYSREAILLLCWLMGRNFRIVAGNITAYFYWKWNYSAGGGLFCGYVEDRGLERHGEVLCAAKTVFFQDSGERFCLGKLFDRVGQIVVGEG